MTIAAILKQKTDEGRADIAAVRPTHSIAAVAGLLAERNIGAVLVRDVAGQLIGIVSERDITRALAVSGVGTLEMTAAQLMTANPHTATPRTTKLEALEMMTRGRFRHLPIVDGGALVGLVSIGDVVNARLRDQEQEVDSLKAYVSG